jgi:hypothetical protein
MYLNHMANLPKVLPEQLTSAGGWRELLLGFIALGKSAFLSGPSFPHP